MTVIHRSDLTYYIRDQVVTIQYRSQFIAFTTYNVGHNKTRFHSFVECLQGSKPENYTTLDQLFGLAREYQLIATKGFNPVKQNTLESIC